MKVERTFDYDLIMSIAAMPEFDVCIEDGMSLDSYVPDKNSAWLLVTDNNDIIGLARLKPLNSIALELHPQILKKHRGMRSQDIVVLLKIATLREKEWFIKDIAVDLGISQSEVSESLNRSKIASLLSTDKKRLMKNNLLDFLEHGLRYVFPTEPETLIRIYP